MKLFDYFSDITHGQAIAIIILIACFHFANSLIVLKTNNFYSYMDESVVSIVDMSCSFCHEYNLLNIIKTQRPISDLIETLISYWKPPVYFLTAFPFLYFIDDINIFITIFNLFISLITLLSVYGIVSKISSKQAGLFASFVLSFLPLFFIIHRTFFIETFLASACALSIYFILPSKTSDKIPNIKIILAISLGLLTKEQFFIYLPFLLMFAFYDGHYKNIKKIINVLLLFVFAFIIAYIVWYYYLPYNIFIHLINYSKENLQPDYLFYFKDFFYFSITPFISMFFIIAFGYFLFKKKNYLWLLSPLLILLIFSLSGNKVTRHVFPLIIFVPVVITLFIYEIKNIALRKFIILLFIVFMSLQFFLINYSENKYYREKNFNNYNQFNALSYTFYISTTETYQMQYLMLKKLIGEHFFQNTVFIHVFPPHVYNFLFLQKNRDGNICNIIPYGSIENIKEEILQYENIIISDRNNEIFSKFDIWLIKNTSLKKTKNIKIKNHDNARIWLYR